MQNQYATGKTIYKGGLFNAHSGTLDPSGYINRESQRRSGLAAMAMSRRNNPGQGSPVGNATKKQLNLYGIYVDPTGKLSELNG